MNNTANNRSLEGKRSLIALIFGLLLHILLLRDTVNVLLPARRIVLVIIAFRLLMLIRSKFTEQGSPKPRYTGWRSGVLPLFLMTPPFVVFLLAWLSTGTFLPFIMEVTFTLGIVLLALIANLVFVVVKPDPNAKDAAQPKPFLADVLFYTAEGLVFGLVTLGIIVLTPESLNDIMAIGWNTLNVFIMILVVQGVIAFFSSLSRRDSEPEKELVPE